MTKLNEQDTSEARDRRGLAERVSKVAMFAGLIGGYGALAAIATRFLFPARPAPRAWMYVAETDTLSIGDTLLFRAPSGETVNVTRQAREGRIEDFIALSSTCPHLGCQVHWEAANNRFFCPCHNGAFDPAGKGISGPPADGSMSLPRYPLKIEAGLLYIEMPVESLSASNRGEVIRRVEGIHGPGHDPCLAGRRDVARTVRRA